MKSPENDNGISNFNGLRVLALESRMAEPMRRLIEKHGGVAQVAPALREIPLENNPQALDFFSRLEAGQVHYFILMTGIGLRTLLKILETHFPKERILAAFQKTQIVVRGPKPTSVCKMSGIPIAVTVPPPNTWQEILEILKDGDRLRGKSVDVLEYGKSDPVFLSQLRSLGAEVRSFAVYQWDLPEDCGPLRQAIEDLLAGSVDVLLQTSAVQIDHLLKMVPTPFEEIRLRRALQGVVIVSIGPATSAQLEERQIYPDLEVFPNKMDNLVETAARESANLLQKKRARFLESSVRLASPSDDRSVTADSPLMRACRREPVDRIPIWLMRQAGRYMTEYQLIRQGKNFLDFCKTPELCVEATLSAVERLNVDAAIIFSDILLILEAMGMPLEFREQEGPVISEPLRSVDGIDRLRDVDPERDLPYLFASIREVRRTLHRRIPLIGFTGAPFTLASYMIEGRGSRNYIPTKTLMHTEPKAWERLMQRLTQACIAYLQAQIAAGCDVVQVFDSWIGCLSPAEYERFVLPHMKRLFAALPAGVPSIHFGTGTATLLELQKSAGATVLGLDWRVEVGPTREALGDLAVQGNFDPVLLFSSIEVIQAEARRILEAGAAKPGFIFNLGHGILPETPVENVLALVDFVHGWKTNF